MATQTPCSEETSAPKVLRLFSDLTLHEEDSTTPRFQLFSAIIYLDKYKSRKPFYLYGKIKAYSPYCEASECVWLPPNDDSAAKQDYDVSTLVSHDSDRPSRMLNKRTLLVLTDTSIPLYTSLYIVVDLYAKACHDDQDDYDYNDDDDDDDEFFRIHNDPQDYKLPLPKYDTFCKYTIQVPDGSIDLIYLVIKDPLDASLDITFKTHPDYDVSGILFTVNLYAYYGDNYGNNGKNMNGFNYLLPLFVTNLVTLSDNCKINLKTSSLAVPANGKLMIWAMIFDSLEGVSYMEERSGFNPKHKGSTNGCIQGSRCSLDVNVNWKYKATNIDSEAVNRESQQHVSNEGGYEREEVKETVESPVC